MDHKGAGVPDVSDHENGFYGVFWRGEWDLPTAFYLIEKYFS